MEKWTRTSLKRMLRRNRVDLRPYYEKIHGEGDRLDYLLERLNGKDCELLSEEALIQTYITVGVELKIPSGEYWIGIARYTKGFDPVLLSDSVLLTETRKRDESFIQAAIRGLQEEAGIDIQRFGEGVSITEDTSPLTRDEHPSSMLPGIISRRMLRKVCIAVPHDPWPNKDWVELVDQGVTTIAARADKDQIMAARQDAAHLAPDITTQVLHKYFIHS